jgi:hypothetical protein
VQPGLQPLLWCQEVERREKEGNDGQYIARMTVPDGWHDCSTASAGYVVTVGVVVKVTKEETEIILG